MTSSWTPRPITNRSARSRAAQSHTPEATSSPMTNTRPSLPVQDCTAFTFSMAWLIRSCADSLSGYGGFGRASGTACTSASSAPNSSASDLRPPRRRAALRSQVDRAQNLFETDVLQPGQVFHMHPGPDRAGGSAQDLGGYRAQEQPAESPVPVRRQRDQIETLRMSVIEDLGGRIPLQEHAPDVELL